MGSRARASVVVAPGLSSCVSQALELWLSSCGAQTYLPCGMWNLPRPGVKPMSPALAGRFFTTEPPRKPSLLMYFHLSFILICICFMYFYFIYMNHFVLHLIIVNTTIFHI